mmetsp:Transcript_10999/g.45653  ORF Transcript_10999/g.45653 Transcript_10999/m.45653 type:complete len:228 (-) Transcript_10999:410-1093(-)
MSVLSLAATFLRRLAMNFSSWPDFLRDSYLSTSSLFLRSDFFSKYGPLPPRARSRWRRRLSSSRAASRLRFWWSATLASSDATSRLSCSLRAAPWVRFTCCLSASRSSAIFSSKTKPYCLRKTRSLKAPMDASKRGSLDFGFAGARPSISRSMGTRALDDTSCGRFLLARAPIFSRASRSLLAASHAGTLRALVRPSRFDASRSPSGTSASAAACAPVPSPSESDSS